MIEQLWQEMEAEGGSVWRLRLARKLGAHPLVIALEPTNQSRGLLVSVPGITLPPRREWPECRGLEWLTINLDGVSYWGVRLRDATCADVFTALAQDLDARLEAAESTEEAAAELFGRLKRWQQFLKAWQDGMGPEARKGLWGELHVLHSTMLPVLGPAAAVSGWKAGSAAHQDFQFSHAAVEVKTTAAKQPQSVRITSERQLDETGVGILFLHVVVVDEREVSMSADTPGQSLSALVAAVRGRLAGELSTLALFNDLLFHRGWLDEHAPRYDSQRLTLREELTYRIQLGFPRLTEADLPIGVGDVNFALSLAACEPFIVPLQEMQDILNLTPSDPSQI
ncbi:MAG: PD-(D/E)XK motif protein [Luteolibacter sp.]